jgi:hypothetical protein
MSRDEHPIIAVELADPPRMNILALLMKGLLENNLKIPSKARRAARVKGEVAVRAGRMQVCITFAGDRITLRNGGCDRPRGRVSGDMRSLLAVVAREALVGPVLTGKVRIGGNPLWLLMLLPIIRVPN